MRPATEEPHWLEIALRLCLLAFYTFVVVIYVTAFRQEPARWTLLLLIVAEGFSLVLVFFANRAVVRDLNPVVVAATVFAVVPGFLMSPDGTVRLMPESVGVALLVAGLAVQMAAKAALGRRFAALPAQRGTIVVRGPYRLVRHPMYLGYAIGDLGFLLANFSVRNAVVIGVLAACQVYRMIREERLLSRDPDYTAYAARVTKRIIPGVW